eukprot:scaffold2714_cov413-Prasinococcus_capsulatus_cf.AAC.8
MVRPPRETACGPCVPFLLQWPTAASASGPYTSSRRRQAAAPRGAPPDGDVAARPPEEQADKQLPHSARGARTTSLCTRSILTKPRAHTPPAGPPALWSGEGLHLCEDSYGFDSRVPIGGEPTGSWFTKTHTDSYPRPWAAGGYPQSDGGGRRILYVDSALKIFNWSK